MPMHTIPQNVSSYEDKIVGMFVGRQFIYLAVGAITAFILISTGGGAAVVLRFILAAGVIGLAAALALVKVNDRGFDAWLLGYAKAVLGPTEWVWQKQIPLMPSLVNPDQAATTVPTSQSKTRQQTNQFNVQRKNAYKSYASGSSKNLDDSEQAFLNHLNFGEPMPLGKPIVLSSQSIAPPMLTPSHPTRVTVSPTIPADSPELVNDKPLAALAQSTTKPTFTFKLDGQPQSVSIMNNQTTNRSLSRQLLSSGVMPVPVRGELRLNLDPSFQQELTNLIGFAPETGAGFTMAAAPSIPILPPTAPLPEMAATPLQASDASMDNKMQAANDWQNTTKDQRHKLQIETEPQSPLPAPLTEKPAESLPDQELSQLAEAEQIAKQAEQQLDTQRFTQANNVQPVVTDKAEINPPLGQVQDELWQVQQQANTLNGPSSTPGTMTQLDEADKALLDQLKREEERSAAFAREMLEQMEKSNAQPPVNTTPTPVATPEPAVKLATEISQPAAQIAPAPAASLETMPTLTDQANVINGYVFDSGGQFIEGAVVVIKDESGEAKRALKSNKLGQFLVTTSLANGHYTVEVDAAGKNVGTMNVELNGKTVPPVVIREKG